MIMAAQTGEQLMFERPIRKYSDEELAQLLKTFQNEKRTGSNSLYFEDVSVGQEIPTVVRGPLTIGDMVAWNAGAGPSYKAGRWGHLDLQKGPHGAVKNPVTGFSVKNSQQHEDFNLAAGRGMPGPFDNGVMRLAWVAPLITNWMGDDGFLKKLDVQVARPGIYGDVTTYAASIVDKDQADGVIKLKITGTNQENEINTKGSAEVVLPRKA
jgi:acyl dehydratase